MIGIIHKDCGELAFRLATEALEMGRPIRANEVFNLDGTHPEPNTQAVCGSCGKAVNFTSEELML